MKKNFISHFKKASIFSLFATSLLPGFSPLVVNAQADETIDPSILQQTQMFAESLRERFTEESENVLYSPLSFYLALTLLKPALEGEEKALLDEVLIGEELDEATYYEHLETLLNLASEGENPAFMTQQYVLSAQDETWNEVYLASLESLHAQAKSVDFQDSSVFEELNKEIADFTNNLIDPYFTEERITELTENDDLMLILLNLLYFKSQWQYTFNEMNNSEESFYGTDGETTVTMMFQKEELAYLENDDYQAVRLPYINDASLLVVLPKEESSTEELQGFYHEVLTRDLAWQYTEVELTLPKWENSASYDLTETLELFGLESFSEDLGDTQFFQNNLDLAIGNILQRVEFKLDENGTEAAAITEINIEKTSAPIEEEEPVVMEVNRPFAYAIEYQGIPLFEGMNFNLSETE